MSDIVSSESKSGKGAGKGRKKASTRVDMTPMVDLGFLLITFFMLTTTLSKQQVMQLNMPDKTDAPVDQPEVNEKKAMTIILGEEDKVYWFVTNKGVPDFHETDFDPENGIRKVLLEKNKQVKDLTVVIKAMDKSKYLNIVDLLDEMHITNTERYALVDINKDDEKLVAKQSSANAQAAGATN